MKLELKHLAPYLPYGLKIEMIDLKGGRCGIYTLDVNAGSGGLVYVGVDRVMSKELKPILRPLSDLTKEIEVDGQMFVASEKIFQNVMRGGKHESDINYAFGCKESLLMHMESMPYHAMIKLFEWHFDVFGLIDSGLAIDINTLAK
jgi:hypothetical protein